MNLRRYFRKSKLRRICLYLFICICICLITVFNVNDDVKGMTSTPSDVIESCPIPDFTEFSEYTNFVSAHQSLNCPNKSRFVSVSQGIVYIKPKSSCQYKCIDWLDDFHSVATDRGTLDNGTKVPCTFFISLCNDIDSEEVYSDFVTAVDRNPRLLERANCKAAFDNLYDILIVGVSSMSYNGWKHMLPETFNHFHTTLRGISFSKFNTLGDGPTVNIQALLTGTKDTEVYESRRRILLNNYIDDYNWIWKHLKRKGYITSFVDENTKVGTFQYRLRGFKSQPTDLYMRSALITAERMKLIKGLCLPSNTLHEGIFDFQNQFDSIYSEVPKFSFIYFSRYSNGDSLRFLDHDLSKFIVSAKQKNPNIFVILYSDDGKFMNRKSSMVGKYEERLPFMGISLPDKKEVERSVLERNSKFLTTSFDLHATLEDIIGIYRPLNGTRHMSLLRPLPDSRVCTNLDIAAYWCSCFQWERLVNPSLHSNIVRLAIQAVKFISDKTRFLRDECEVLNLEDIVKVDTISPTSDVLKFKKSADPDGFIPDMSDSTKQDIFWYQIDLKTKPSGIIFRVSFVAKRLIPDDNNSISIIKMESKDVIKLSSNHNSERCLQTVLKNNQNLLHSIERFCLCKK